MNFVILFQTFPWKIKMLEIPFQTISELCYFVSNHSAEDKKMLDIPFRIIKQTKNFWKLIPYHSRTKKNTWMTFKKHLSQNSVPFRTSECAIPKTLTHIISRVPFHSEPRNGLFGDTRNSVKGPLFSAE